MPSHHIQLSSLNTLRQSRLNGPGKGALVAELNRSIDVLQIPTDINESIIESLLKQWEQHAPCQLPGYWLVAARLFEMSLLTAGHYVDNCEFEAAGDLLFNPRKIIIYQKGRRRPWVKWRHGRLSDQLGGAAHKGANEPFPKWIGHRIVTRISRPAILPHLLSCMKQSGRISPAYMQKARCRLEKASQAIGFLCSWSISDAEDLYSKMQAASPQTRRFIHHHLCTFDTTLFDALGEEIHRLRKNPQYRSDFITSPSILDATSNSRRSS